MAPDPRSARGKGSLHHSDRESRSRAPTSRRDMEEYDDDESRYSSTPRDRFRPRGNSEYEASLAPIPSGSASRDESPRYETSKEQSRRPRIDTRTSSGRGDDVRASVSRPAPYQQRQAANEGGTNSAQLGQITQEFIAIEFEDFERCAEFINDHPEICTVNATTLEATAAHYHKLGEGDIVRRCLERALLIQICQQQNVREELKVPYVESLAHDTARFTSFRREYRKLKDRVIPKEDIPVQPSSSAAAARRQSTNLDSATATSARSAVRGQSISEGFHNLNINDTQSLQSDSYGVSPPTNIGGSMAPASRRQSVSGYPRQSTSYSARDTSGPGTAQTAQYGSISTPIKSAGNAKSSLNSNYIQRRPTFFEFGKVFKVLWHQPAGADLNGNTNDANLTLGKYGEGIYSTTRWMMVIRQKSGHCLCCPISTYGGRGLASKQFRASDLTAHAIVYATGMNPVRLPNEPDLSKSPIPISLANETVKIDSASRIHFGRIHTVEYNVKVMDVGNVPMEYFPRVMKYVNDEFESSASQGIPR